MNNSFGGQFGITSFGESHGKSVGCLVDGCPSNFKLLVSDIQRELERRRPGKTKFVSPRGEKDEVEILSGIFNSRTTGNPIALLINNADVKSRDYSDLAISFRPGHADFSYFIKYSNRDFRGGGRASARLTAPIVAGGAVAKRWLRYHYGTTFHSFVSGVGSIRFPFVHWFYVNSTPFFTPTTKLLNSSALIKRLISIGDSIGADALLQINNIPTGLGEPLFNKITARLASGIVGINAVKAVRFGQTSRTFPMGSEQNDPIASIGFLSNNWGGVAGGISTGQDVVLSISVKPTSSINQYKRSLDERGEPLLLKTKGRHDPCVGLRIPPILEAVGAIVTMDLVLQHRPQEFRRCTGLFSLDHPKAYLY